MPLTPVDIQHIEFAKAARGRGGYDIEQVDAMLDQVSVEMAQLLEERAALQRRVDNAGPPADRAEPAEALRAELERARRECDQAREHADALWRRLEETRKATAASPSVLAPGDAGPVMALAQRAADDHLNDAHQRSRKLTAEAGEEIERVTHEARQTVHDIEEAAGHQQQQAAADLRTGDADRRREIEELTRFAESYRSALEHQMQAQTHLLGGQA